MAISKRLRYEVLRRDNHACRYCGASAPEVKLHVDHVAPVALGGTDDPSNLAAACADCNSGKSASSPDAPIIAQVQDDALRWGAAMHLAAAERAAAHVYRRELCDWFRDRWNAWTWTDWRGDKHTFDLPGTYAASILQFHDAGLITDDLEELLSVAMSSRSNDTWRYFCGCCWRRVRDAQARATEILREANDGA